ncbi:hypothetical protein P0136_08865 [Lentisphaerota bacterium ZTH]|nr:hypothetical protein JYG24_00030 [Lentisphaerota bacterium]WET05474.1 hypothetical protein P0136_08865 [Lentisphaerota bacterium ZTH]
MDGVKLRNFIINCLVGFGVLCAILVFIDASYWKVGMSPLYSSPDKLSFPWNIGTALIYFFTLPGFAAFGAVKMLLPTDIPVIVSQVIEYASLFIGQVVFYYIIGMLLGLMVKTAASK